jgi:hypothetical protein
MVLREAGDKRFQRVNITPLTEELNKNAMTCSSMKKMRHAMLKLQSEV